VELHRGNPLELSRALKREKGKDIWLCGGARLAGSLLPEIDELILKINQSGRARHRNTAVRKLRTTDTGDLD
jgi:dihydrofolate reductase